MKVNYRLYALLFSVISFFLMGCDDSITDTTVTNKATLSFGTTALRTFENITPLQIPVVLSCPVAHDVEIRGEVKKEDNAKEGKDYLFHSKSIVIPKGQTVGYFMVDLTDDMLLNPDRIFDFELVDVKGATLNEKVDECKVIISSDEGFSTVGFAQTLVSVPEEQETLNLSICLNKKSEVDVHFSVRCKQGVYTAINGEHFILDEEAVYTITAGDSVVNVPLSIIDDIVENENREFELEIYGNDNSFISQVYGYSKITIVNDEKKSYISFQKTAFKVVEGDSIWIPVKIEGHPRQVVKAMLEVCSGDAEEGTDFVLLRKELVFPVSTLVDSIQIAAIDNSVRGLDKSFTIRLTNLENVTIADKDTLVSVVIANDDFDFKDLYEALTGEWSFTHTTSGDGAGGPGTTTVTISTGDTPEEEDANYLKYLIVKAKKFGEKKFAAEFRLKYDATDGSLALVTGDVITTNVPFGDKKSDIKLACGEDFTFDLVKITPSRDYSTLTWDPAIQVRAGIYYPADYKEASKAGTRWGYWFDLRNVVMTRVK